MSVLHVTYQCTDSDSWNSATWAAWCIKMVATMTMYVTESTGRDKYFVCFRTSGRRTQMLQNFKLLNVRPWKSREVLTFALLGPCLHMPALNTDSSLARHDQKCEFVETFHVDKLITQIIKQQKWSFRSEMDCRKESKMDCRKESESTGVIFCNKLSSMEEVCEGPMLPRGVRGERK